MHVWLSNSICVKGTKFYMEGSLYANFPLVKADLISLLLHIVENITSLKCRVGWHLVQNYNTTMSLILCNYLALKFIILGSCKIAIFSKINLVLI
jgi:hypothetical protein